MEVSQPTITMMGHERDSLRIDRPSGWEWVDAAEFFVSASIALLIAGIVAYRIFGQLLRQQLWLDIALLLGSIVVVFGFVVRDFKRKRVSWITGAVLAIWFLLAVLVSNGAFAP
jgi:hypothetical protein